MFVEGTVTGPTGKHATLKFLVDSGATYTLLPNKVWRAIGLKPMDSVNCVLADGTEVVRKVSDCLISLPQGERHTPVMLGEKGDEALLGMVTLEEFRLILNPFTRQLQPMRMMLASRTPQPSGFSFLNRLEVPRPWLRPPPGVMASRWSFAPSRPCRPNPATSSPETPLSPPGVGTVHKQSSALLRSPPGRASRRSQRLGIGAAGESPRFFDTAGRVGESR